MMSKMEARSDVSALTSSIVPATSAAESALRRQFPGYVHHVFHGRFGELTCDAPRGVHRGVLYWCVLPDNQHLRLNPLRLLRHTRKQAHFATAQSFLLPDRRQVRSYSFLNNPHGILAYIPQQSAFGVMMVVSTRNHIASSMEFPYIQDPHSHAFIFAVKVFFGSQKGEHTLALALCQEVIRQGDPRQMNCVNVTSELFDFCTYEIGLPSDRIMTPLEQEESVAEFVDGEGHFEWWADRARKMFRYNVHFRPGSTHIGLLLMGVNHRVMLSEQFLRSFAGDWPSSFHRTLVQLQWASFQDLSTAARAAVQEGQMIDALSQNEKLSSFDTWSLLGQKMDDVLESYVEKYSRCLDVFPELVGIVQKTFALSRFKGYSPWISYLTDSEWMASLISAVSNAQVRSPLPGFDEMDAEKMMRLCTCLGCDGPPAFSIVYKSLVREHFLLDTLGRTHLTERFHDPFELLGSLPAASFITPPHPLNLSIFHIALPSVKMLSFLLQHTAINRSLIFQQDNNGFSSLHCAAMGYPKQFRNLFRYVDDDRLAQPDLKNLVHCACSGQYIVVLRDLLPRLPIEALLIVDVHRNRNVFHSIVGDYKDKPAQAKIAIYIVAMIVKRIELNCAERDDVICGLLNGYDCSGRTPVQLAAAVGTSELVKCFLDLGASVGQSLSQESPFWIMRGIPVQSNTSLTSLAVYFGQEEVLQVLQSTLSDKLVESSSVLMKIQRETRRILRQFPSIQPFYVDVSPLVVIDENELCSMQWLAEGAFADTYLYMWCGRQTVVKEIKDWEGSLSQWCSFLGEIVFLRLLSFGRPESFPTVYGIVELEVGNFAIAMEHIPAVSLGNWCRRNPSLLHRIAVLSSLADGLQFMHELNIRHHDISDTNVLVRSGSPLVDADSLPVAPFPDRAVNARAFPSAVLIDLGLSCLRTHQPGKVPLVGSHTINNVFTGSTFADVPSSRGARSLLSDLQQFLEVCATTLSDLKDELIVIELMDALSDYQHQMCQEQQTWQDEQYPFRGIAEICAECFSAEQRKMSSTDIPAR